MRGTVVMVHCMWGGSWIWDRYAPLFEQRGWRCLRPVLRHHDVDPAAPPDPRLGSVSLLDYAADLEAYVRGLGEPPVLLGHSMGGLLSMMLAARGLGRAAALLTPGSPAGVNALTGSVVRSFLGVLLRPAFWKTPMRLSFKAAAYAMLGTLPPEERRATYDRLTPASMVRKTAALLGSKAELREFPGHGHWVVGEPGWEEIAGFVADWLEAHTGG